MKRFLALALLLPLVASADVSLTLTVNADNTIDTAFPAGDKTAPAALTWSLTSLNNTLGIVTSTAFSQNVRTCCLSGTGSGAATITIVDVQGDVAADNGWVISGGSTLSNPGTDADLPGSGAFRLRATNGSDVADSDAINWSYIAASGTDVTAPTIPVGLVCTAELNNLACVWNASSDTESAGDDPSGVKEYEVFKNSVLDSTVAAVNQNSLPASTAVNIGGSDGSPSSSQTGNNWNIQFAGTGIDSTADNIRFNYVPVTGNFIAYVKVDSVTSSASFPKGGIMARDSTAAGSRFVFCGHQEAATPKAKFRIRATTDATSQDLALVAVSSTTWYRLTRTGNSWQCDYSSDSQSWLPVFNAVVQELSAPALVGLMVTGNNGTSTNALYQFQNLGITTGTATISADVAATAQATIKVRARDNDLNTSAFSASTTVTPLSESPPAAGAKKWNPGHYLKTTGNPGQNNTAAYIQEVVDDINQRVNDDAEILGAYVQFGWGTIETSQGVYDFTDIYTVYNLLAGYGKYLILDIPYKSFSSDTTNTVPSYLSSELYQTVRTDPQTSVAELWEPDNMDKYIAMWEAVAAEFDDKPFLEMVSWSESTPSLAGDTPTNYTKAGFATQLKRLYTATGAAFTETNVGANIAFLSGQVCGADGLIEAAYNTTYGRYYPDLRPNDGDSCMDGSDPSAVRTYTDTIANGSIVSFSVLNGKNSSGISDTPTLAISYALTNGVTHLAWYPSYNSATRTGRTWSDILTAIGAATSPNDISDAACPTQYTTLLGGCQ